MNSDFYKGSSDGENPFDPLFTLISFSFSLYVGSRYFSNGRMDVVGGSTNSSPGTPAFGAAIVGTAGINNSSTREFVLTHSLLFVPRSVFENMI